MGVVDGFGLKQLGVGEDDAELIVQPMKEQPQVPINGRTISMTARVRPACVCSRRWDHAWDPAGVSAGRAPEGASWPDERHSVSAKMRMDPPAVRTYSTLPAEIQL